MSNVYGNAGIGVVGVPARVQRSGFSERFGRSAAFRVFLRLQLGGGRPALVSSLHQEAVRALVAGDRLRAARFYGASARVLVKLREFEVAGDRFREQGKQLKEEASRLQSQCKRWSPLYEVHIPLRVFELFIQAARAFENAAGNIPDGVAARNEAHSSAGECYNSAAGVARWISGMNSSHRELASQARGLLQSAASAFEAAGNEAEKEEALKLANSLSS